MLRCGGIGARDRRCDGKQPAVVSTGSSATSSTEPRSRVVLVGASNLTRSISTAVETALLALGRPLEFMVAMGHGRSFGMESSVLGRKISGIFSCGLWHDLAAASPRPTFALVTDVGNDILYGATVQQIVDWVEACLDRLEAASAETVMTEIPIGSVERLTPWQFRVIRRLFFPFNRLPMNEVVAAARQLNERLRRVAESRKIPLIPVENAWFGFDPIHIRRRYWSDAWDQIVRQWSLAAPVARGPRGSLRRWLYLRSLVPEERMLWGISQRRRQPAGRLPCGSTIALY